MKCQFCSQELPNKAYFCFNCKSQIKCKKCDELLIPGANMCINCGSNTTLPKQENKNYIEFQEDEKSRKFSASFSDETAAHIANTFVQFLPSKPRVHDAIVLPSHTEENIDATTVLESSGKILTSPTPSNIVTHSNDVDKIFTVKGEKVVLKEKRLKAKSSLDYEKRLTMLFLLYSQINGKQEVDRAELNTILNADKLNSSGFRAWLPKASNLITNDSQSKALSLTPEGEEKAQVYLSEVLDDNIENEWRLGQNSKSTQALPNVKSIKHKQPRLVSNLCLNPDGKESLTEFMAKYNYGKSNPRIILLFAYYLIKISGENEVTQDHIFTCYRFTNTPLPNNLYQTIADSMRRQKWLENQSNIRITNIGYNEVEHKLLK